MRELMLACLIGPKRLIEGRGRDGSENGSGLVL